MERDWGHAIIRKTKCLLIMLMLAGAMLLLIPKAVMADEISGDMQTGLEEDKQEAEQTVETDLLLTNASDTENIEDISDSVQNGIIVEVENNTDDSVQINTGESDTELNGVDQSNSDTLDPAESTDLTDDTSETETSTIQIKTDYVTIYNGIDYSLVYDYNYFQEKYQDVKEAFDDDDVATLQNFVCVGMLAGRQGCAAFDVYSYKNGYQDLRLAYGNDLTKYYTHYIKYGYNEGRARTTGITEVMNPVTVKDNVDYSAVYDYYYFSSNPDVKAAFGSDDIATLANFVRWGMPSGRQGCAAFDVHSYKNGYQDLRLAYGNDLTKYYTHYMKYGKGEGRTRTTGITVVMDPVTVKDDLDYAAVYDYYYYSLNVEVKVICGNDDIAALDYFIRWGMADGKQGCAAFDVYSYKNGYQDLRLAYGNNLAKYYIHYIKYGKDEGRTRTTGITEVMDPVTVKGNIDYAAVYDYYYYTSDPTIKAAFGNDDIATLENFISKGIPAGQRGNEEFDVDFYREKYDTLEDTYGDNLKGYYLHYIWWGRAAGLIGSREDDEKFLVSSNGESVKSWSDYKNGKIVYYLFLMNDMDLTDLTVNISRIQISGASEGNVDIENNIITGLSVDNNTEIKVVDSDMKTYVLAFMKSTLRSVSITLNGTDLETIAAGSKDEKYEGNTIKFIDNDLTTVEYTDTEVKGRGNSTWYYKDKLPYQIKLAKKQSVFGMDKAKKWVLLANAYDESLLRNSVAFDLAKELGVDANVDYEYCDLWIDGQYQGNYIICEKVEIGSGRVELENEDGALLELDENFYSEEDYWIETLIGHVTVKEVVSDDEAAASEKALNTFNETLEGLFHYLENTSEPTLDGLGKYIDVESFAQFYLMCDYLMCWDSSFLSAYFYQDGAEDVIHFGPVWDYDTSMGNMKNDYIASDRYISTNSLILAALIDTKAFREYLSSYYEDNQQAFSEITQDLETKYQMLVDTNSAAMNFIKDDQLGQQPMKGNTKVFAETYATAYANLESWLTNRYSIYDPVNAVFDVLDVKRSGTDLIITSNNSGLKAIVIWSDENGLDDALIIPTSRAIINTDGSYVFTYSLTNLKDNGKVIVAMQADSVDLNTNKYYYVRVLPCVSDGTDYSPVFNAEYYWENNEELQSVYSKDDTDALLYHFVTWGMKAGLQASEEFNVDRYKANHPELISVYGDTLEGYYLHYIRWGRDAGWQAI